MDMTRVTQFWKHYQTKSTTNPNLYVSGNSINVILPNNLLEYANAAAGHSGFGAGARARGIRRSVDNPKRALAEIFESPQTLAEFLQSSECNADEYVETVRRRHLNIAPRAKTDERSADSAFKDILAKVNIQDLIVRFGKEDLMRSRKCLTVNEFELRYGI